MLGGEGEGKGGEREEGKGGGRRRREEGEGEEEGREDKVERREEETCSSLGWSAGNVCMSNSK